MTRRLDVELVRRGLARSRTQARELVTAGVVRVDGRPASKPALPVGESSTIELTREPDRWVGRAALKLLHALGTLGPSAGRGSALPGRGGEHRRVHPGAARRRRGARDRARRRPRPAGPGGRRATRGSMSAPGTNIRDVRPGDLGHDFDLVVADLSFISLRLVLDAIAPGD